MRNFKPGFASSIATILVVPILFGLSYWQYQRGQLKQKKIAKYQQSTTQAARKLLTAQDFSSTNLYELVTFTGQLSPINFLLDNEIHDHQTGVLVYTPVLLPQINKFVLLERGWLALPNRAKLPALRNTNSPIRIIGHWQQYQARFTLSSALENQQAQNQLLQTLDWEKLSQALGRPLLPFVLKLEPGPHTFTYIGPQFGIVPIKHYAYALQWLAMGLSAMVYYVLINSSKDKQMPSDT